MPDYCLAPGEHTVKDIGERATCGELHDEISFEFHLSGSAVYSAADCGRVKPEKQSAYSSRRATRFGA
jgi:hypothetical protein